MAVRRGEEYLVPLPGWTKTRVSRGNSLVAAIRGCCIVDILEDLVGGLDPDEGVSPVVPPS